MNKEFKKFIKDIETALKQIQEGKCKVYTGKYEDRKEVINVKLRKYSIKNIGGDVIMERKGKEVTRHSIVSGKVEFYSKDGELLDWVDLTNVINYYINSH